MQVAILAGGLGTRLKPMTENVPKSMIPVGDDPFLLILLKLLKKNNFKKILLLVGYLSNIITDYFGDGSKFGLEIKYSFEKEPLGTAGCLRNSYDLLEQEFLLLNGDTYLGLSYQSFLEYAEEKKSSLITLAAYDGLKYDDIVYNMKVEKNGIVTAYSKSDMKQEYNAVDAGVYHVNKKILDYVHKEKSSLEYDIFPKLIAENKMSAYLTKEKFFDIGTIQRLHGFKNRMP